MPNLTNFPTPSGVSHVEHVLASTPAAEPVTERRPGCVEVLGLPLAKLGTEGVLSHLFGALDEGRGGWLLTANLDILRRFDRDQDARRLYAQANLTVADGMPLVWASHVAGEPVPERVAGASMMDALAARAAATGRRVFLLGGATGAAEGTRDLLQARHPGLRVCGVASPMLSAVPTQAELSALAEIVVPAEPDLLLVAFGSPKQEYVIDHLHGRLPRAWKIGVGNSFSFITGQTRRAPQWMQRVGLEWVHRLSQEPSRLAKRYLVDDVPFMFELFARLAYGRARGTR